MLSDSKKTAEIVSIHVTIFIHKQFCYLVLDACHKMTVYASNRIEISRILFRISDSVQLTQKDEIQIDECIYLFKYDEDADTKKYEQ